MTDHVSKIGLLPTVESRQVEVDVVDLLEDKERPDAPQITLKYGDAFLVTDACGDLLASRQEMGLYWHGTRYMRTCNLFLEGRPLLMLSHHIADMGDACQIDLTNTAFTLNNGYYVEQGAIHISRLLEMQHEHLIQTITVTSFCSLPVPLTLTLKIDADFRDLFEARGMQRAKRGTLLPTALKADGMTLSYRGVDEVERTTQVHWTLPCSQGQSDRAHWRIFLERGEPVELRITTGMSEAKAERYAATNVALPSWHSLPRPTIRSNDYLFNRLFTRGMNDLLMLATMTPHGYYPYAGIPWFSTPFGRDGLITCLEFLPWFPEVTRGALSFLAAYQGTRLDPFTDEEPGKMLHEMRSGEMANLREIPYIPYYGSIDVTPLFLITLEEYIRWTNDRALLEQIWPNAQAAAQWLVEYGDRDGDGFIEYHKASEKGLANQGWKDAWDAISHRDGRLAPSPIALCEVQAYAFAAYRAMNYLATRLGHIQEAERWQQRATTLQERFLRDFWWEEEGTFYLALDAEKQPCEVVASNPGQCLWTGIVPAEKAEQIISRLMQADMYSGWGLRTLSTTAVRYNPMSYHNGSVWPHDTALVGAGFARYNAKAEAGTLIRSLYQSSLFFEGARLPELYCGFPLRQGYGPTRYPVACSPQAWAAGAPFLLLNALLGLQPDAEHQRLTLVRPTLPDWLQSMEIRGLRLGDRCVHLRLMLSGEQTTVMVEDENQVEVNVLEAR
jgi:glycogen debranching enzyme